MGLHRRTDPGDSFWGAYTQGLITDINRQIMICRIIQPLGTLRRIHVAVPSRVEFEAGFYRWIERLSRLASNLGCRMIFHGRKETMTLINEYIQNRHPDVRAEYELMQHWKSITQLATQINNDHLLVVITARPGTVSYKPASENRPARFLPARFRKSARRTDCMFPVMQSDDCISRPERTASGCHDIHGTTTSGTTGKRIFVNNEVDKQQERQGMKRQ